MYRVACEPELPNLARRSPPYRPNALGLVAMVISGLRVDNGSRSAVPGSFSRVSSNFVQRHQIQNFALLLTLVRIFRPALEKEANLCKLKVSYVGMRRDA